MIILHLVILLFFANEVNQPKITLDNELTEEQIMNIKSTIDVDVDIENEYILTL